MISLMAYYITILQKNFRVFSVYAVNCPERGANNICNGHILEQYRKNHNLLINCLYIKQ